jgi:CO/xanthine dehydrogenase FAD-binding subunit
MAKLDAAGRAFEDVRLAIAGVAPKPIRLTDVESFLRGGALNMDRLEQAAELPVALVASRTRQDYRRDVVRGFLKRGLINAAKRANADPAVLTPAMEAAYG